MSCPVTPVIIMLLRLLDRGHVYEVLFFITIIHRRIHSTFSLNLY
nr:MAG TPA: hypothetical protein [Caudoviricetes sp.]